MTTNAFSTSSLVDFYLRNIHEIANDFKNIRVFISKFFH